MGRIKIIEVGELPHDYIHSTEYNATSYLTQPSGVLITDEVGTIYKVRYITGCEIIMDTSPDSLTTTFNIPCREIEVCCGKNMGHTIQVKDVVLELSNGEQQHLSYTEIKRLNTNASKKQWLIEALKTARIEDREEDYNNAVEAYEAEITRYNYTLQGKKHPKLFTSYLPYETFKVMHPRYDWDKAKEIFKQYRELED